MRRHLLWLIAFILLAAGVANAAEEARWTTKDCDRFMREVAQYVYDHHLKKDDRSEQKGMIYEYFQVKRAGKVDQFVQGEALDTMHDGAWFASALVHAWRATGDAWYLNFLRQYPLPFYVKVLNHSHELFTDLSGAWSDGKPWPQPAKPEKGFCPYWWDDGASVSLDRILGGKGFAKTDRLAGRPNPDHRLDGYCHGTSNHMAQDLAVMLLQGWIATRDPQVAEAAKNLFESRFRHFPGHIPVVSAAAGFTNQDEKLLKAVPAPKPFVPFGWSYRIIYDFKPEERYTTQGFTDDDEYMYFYTLAKNRTIDRETAKRLIYLAATNYLPFYYWHDVTPYQCGMNRIDLQPLYARNGKLELYESDNKPLAVGSRMGPQSLVTAVWALQLLKAYPGCWAERAPAEAKDDRLVPIVETAPTIDQARDEVYGEPFVLAGARLSFASDLRNLYVFGEAQNADAVTFDIYARPNAQGTHSVIVATHRGDLTVTNGAGKELVFEAKIDPAMDGVKFEIKIPYAINKGQAAWANGIEHGRLSVRAGEAVVNLYLLSSEQALVKRLEREVSEGLSNWRRIFRDFGYIPAGIGPVRWHKDRLWSDFSDTGGYAHLISAAAMYRMYLEGRRDWEEAVR